MTPRELVARCRRLYRECADLPVLDLLAVALGYELAAPDDTEGSVLTQHALTILGWGVPLDDELLACLAGKAAMPAYLPAHFDQDRYVVRRHGRDVLVRAEALTSHELDMIAAGRQEIERRGLWDDPDLAVAMAAWKPSDGF